MWRNVPLREHSIFVFFYLYIKYRSDVVIYRIGSTHNYSTKLHRMILVLVITKLEFTPMSYLYTYVIHLNKLSRLQSGVCGLNLWRKKSWLFVTDVFHCLFCRFFEQSLWVSDSSNTLCQTKRIFHADYNNFLTLLFLRILFSNIFDKYRWLSFLFPEIPHKRPPQPIRLTFTFYTLCKAGILQRKIQMYGKSICTDSLRLR